MTLYEQIILEMTLNEGVEIPDIESALDTHKAVNLYYVSTTKEDIADGERKIYPIAYGLSTAGNPVVRAYQPEGDSASSVPDWKLFRIDGIKEWETTDETFTTRDIPNLRIKHDAQMSMEYKTAFGGRYSAKSEDVPEIDKQRIDHTPVSSDEIDNANNVTRDMQTPASQNTTVRNEPENLDIPPQTSHIPVGVDNDTVEAPEAKPVSQTQITPDYEFETEPEESPEIPQSNPSEPIYQDDEEDDEEEEYNVEDDETAQDVHSLMDRMDNIKR